MIIIYVNYQKWHVCNRRRRADLTHRDTHEQTHMCTTQCTDRRFHVHESAMYDDKALLGRIHTQLPLAQTPSCRGR